MAGAVTVRPATSADAPALARLHRASREAAMPWLPVLHTPEEDLAWMHRTVLATTNVLVATVDGGPVGFVSRRAEWIEHLYLSPAHLRRGVGTLLLAAATADDPPLLRLRTFARNATARAFYEAHRFTAAGGSDENEEREPDILYERRRGAPATHANHRTGEHRP